MLFTADLGADGVAPNAADTELSAAASFVGQGLNLTVSIDPATPNPAAAIREAFIAAHQQAHRGA